MSEKKTYRLDRTAFKINTFEEAADQVSYWKTKTTQERLAAAWYLTCQAYNLDPEAEHRLDRTVFSMRNRP